MGKSKGGKPSRDKGQRYMRRVVNWLGAHGWPLAEVRSAGQAGADVLGVMPWAIECKDMKNVTQAIHDGLLQAEAVADLTGQWPVAIVHTPSNADAGRDYAVMRVADWNRLALLVEHMDNYVATSVLVGDLTEGPPR